MIHAHYLLKDGESLDVNEGALSRDGSPGLIVAHGNGQGIRGCALNVQGAVAGIWIPLRGRLQVDTLPLHPGDLHVTGVESGVQVSARGRSVWVSLFGTAAAWRRFVMDADRLASPLLPARYEAGFGALRLANALRQPRAGRPMETAASALIDRVVAAQEGFAVAIGACPGRTYRQRRQVFLRLQRIRNYLASCCQAELDNDALARMAGYSASHFIRIFRAAYGETPHVYLVRQRMRHANRLLMTSPLAISEIALASGFDNPSTFSRVFREHFGTTARSVREAVSMRRSRPRERSASSSMKSAINRMSFPGF